MMKDILIIIILFLEIVIKNFDVCNKIEEYAKRNFEVDQNFIDEHKATFKYWDVNNSRRVYEAILNMERK